MFAFGKEDDTLKFYHTSLYLPIVVSGDYDTVIIFLKFTCREAAMVCARCF